MPIIVMLWFMNKLNFNALVQIRSQATEPFTYVDGADVAVANSLISDVPMAATGAKSQLQRLDWTDCYVENIRFVAAKFDDCTFDRVVFYGCDFSAVSFNNCLLRNCFFVNVKSVSHLSFSDCIIDGLVVIRSKFDGFEVQNSKIAVLSFVEITIKQLLFQSCKVYKRSGLFSVLGSELTAVGGLESLPKVGVKVQVDAELWRDLGDYYLKQKGIAALANEDVDPVGRSLDRALSSLSHR